MKLRRTLWAPAERVWTWWRWAAARVDAAVIKIFLINMALDISDSMKCMHVVTDKGCCVLVCCYCTDKGEEW